jgi:hypothetical protein
MSRDNVTDGRDSVLPATRLCKCMQKMTWLACAESLLRGPGDARLSDPFRRRDLLGLWSALGLLSFCTELLQRGLALPYLP